MKRIKYSAQLYFIFGIIRLLSLAIILFSPFIGIPLVILFELIDLRQKLYFLRIKDIKTEIKYFRTLYFFNIFLRIVYPFSILLYPLAGWFICFFIDIFDFSITLRANINISTYQLFDKSLDQWFIGFLVITFYLYGWPGKEIALALFLVRLIGEFLYFKTKKELFLVCFPNILEFFFPIFIIMSFYIFGLNNMDSDKLLIALVLSTILKLIQEYLAHFRVYRDPVCAKYLKKFPQLNN